MRTTTSLGTAAAVLLLGAAPATAQSSTYLDLDGPVGLSADGVLVVTRHGYQNRLTGMELDLRDFPVEFKPWGPAAGGGNGWELHWAQAVSTAGDRMLVTLKKADGSGDRYAARWDAVSGWALPGDFPGCDSSHVNGNAMSDDGSVVAGSLVNPSCKWQPMAWRPGTAMDAGYPLPPTQLPETVWEPGLDESSNVWCISGDGRAVGGWQAASGAAGHGGREASVWIDGVQTILAHGTYGEVHGLNRDGTIAVGKNATLAGNVDAVLWDLTTSPPTPEFLGFVSPSATDSAIATEVSGNGNVVTGRFGNIRDPFAVPGAGFYLKRSVNGSPASEVRTSLGARVGQAGDVFPEGSLVGLLARDLAGERGNTMIYDVLLPGLVYGPGGGTPFLIDLPVLEGDTDRIDLELGGEQVLSLDAGPSNAHQVYVVLGSASGTSPGWTVGPANPVDLSGLQGTYDNQCNWDPNCTPPATLPADGAGDMVLPLYPDSYFLATATTLFGLWPDTVLDVGDLSTRAVSNAVPCDLAL
jgi:hypothetical protein